MRARPEFGSRYAVMLYRVGVPFGGSEVDNPLRTFLNGVNSRRDIWRVLALNSPEGGGGQD
jgi:hypothetical protein